jgi:hypothetical protein
MAIGDKPSDLPEWASGAEADITEPSSGKKSLGWVLGEFPPHNVFNWIQNLFYQWIAFLQNYSANHRHDGGSSDLSAPKINPTDHIDWGDNGEVEVVTDTVSEHIIEHRPVGTASTKFSSNVIIAGSALTLGCHDGAFIDLEDISSTASVSKFQLDSTDAQPSGLSVPVLEVTESGNGFASGSSSEFNQDSILSLGNLIKANASFRFTEDPVGSGLWSQSTISRYNFAGNFLRNQIGPNSVYFTIAPTDTDEIRGVIISSVATVDSGTGDYKLNLSWDSVNERVVMEIRYFSSGVWTTWNPNLAAPSGMDIIVNFTII